MTLNPQRKLSDGVYVPFDRQRVPDRAKVFAVGNTVELRADEWVCGSDTLVLTITVVRENASGIWIDGTDEHGTLFSHVIVPHSRTAAVAERWLASHR